MTRQRIASKQVLHRKAPGSPGWERPSNFSVQTRHLPALSESLRITQFREVSAGLKAFDEFGSSSRSVLADLTTSALNMR
jgi:hypothetical protein